MSINRRIVSSFCPYQPGVLFVCACCRLIVVVVLVLVVVVALVFVLLISSRLLWPFCFCLELFYFISSIYLFFYFFFFPLFVLVYFAWLVLLCFVIWFIVVVVVVIVLYFYVTQYSSCQVTVCPLNTDRNNKPSKTLPLVKCALIRIFPYLFLFFIVFQGVTKRRRNQTKILEHTR